VADLVTRIGRILAARYRIEREIGSGGMATVYLARDLKHDRDIALKVLRPELTAMVGAERFLKEIRITAKLDHPHILTLIDSGEGDDILWYALPYVRGETLRRKLDREKQLDIDEALGITRGIAGALEYAHQHGVIHRDIKPENILLFEGEAMLMDFGIALALSHAGGARLTESGLSLGTPQYMSPEQATGDRDLDPRTDVYSLGAVLYEMLAGEPPHTGSSAQAVIAKLLTERPTRLRILRSTISEGVDAAVAKALAKSPADRFATAAQFMDALGAVQPSRTRFWVPIAAVASVAGLAAALSVGGFRNRIFPPATEAASAIKLAVLPFVNISGDSAQEYFSDGLTEEMITELGRVHPQRLALIARTSAMRYKKTDKSTDRIGRELGVEYILEGSTRRERSRVRISAQLIRVRDQTQVWADSYDRDLTEILAVQSAVAQGVAHSLVLVLLPEEQRRLVAARPVNPEAYEAYLKGISHHDKLTKPDLETALQYFAIALKKDPDYALAHVGVAAGWIGLQQMGFVPPREAQPRLKEAVSHALALDSTLAEAHYFRAIALAWSDWDWSAAEEEFQRAMRLNPNFPEGRAAYAHFLMIMKRPGEATRHIDLALELDPFNPLVRAFYGAMLTQLGRHNESIAQFRQVLVTVPNMPMALNGTQNALYNAGRYEEALAAERSNWAARGDTDLVAALDRGYAEGGYRGASRGIAGALATRSRTANVATVRVAHAYVRAGDFDRAFEWLERSYQAHDPNLAYLGVAPAWAPLRADPRFQNLMRRMKLPT
jgi:eukaryotic-like serine/threonine-protein kinase